MAPGYLAFLAVLVIPLIGAFAMSFYRTDYVTRTFVGLDNYWAILTKPEHIRVLINTIKYVVIIVPTSVATSLFISLLIHPLPKALQSFFRGAFYLPAVVGGIVLSVVWLWMYDPTYGLFNYLLSLLGMKPVPWLASAKTSLYAVSLVVFTMNLGTQVILFLAGLANIPEDVLDAARVDGANAWRIVWQVMIPLLRPVLAFVIAIQTIGVFQIWETIFMLTSGGPNNSSASAAFSIYQIAFLFSRWGLASAMGVVLMLIVVTVTLIQTRFWGESWEY